MAAVGQKRTFVDSNRSFENRKPQFERDSMLGWKGSNFQMSKSNRSQDDNSGTPWKFVLPLRKSLLPGGLGVAFKRMCQPLGSQNPNLVRGTHGIRFFECPLAPEADNRLSAGDAAKNNEQSFLEL